MGQNDVIEYYAEFDTVDRVVAMLSRDYAPSATTGPHWHHRGQVLHAKSGAMRLSTATEHWVVPLGYVAWIPPEIVHDIYMYDAVEMRTAYVEPCATATLPAACRVFRSSPLLNSCIQAFAREPQLYEEAGRGGHLAALILDEVERSVAAPMALPLPVDPRLASITAALIDNPALDLRLDDWAKDVGMSRRGLTRAFRFETGLSLGQWRRNLRRMVAATYLANGMSRTKAARRVGYSNPGSLDARPDDR